MPVLFLIVALIIWGAYKLYNYLSWDAPAFTDDEISKITSQCRGKSKKEIDNIIRHIK